MVDPDITHKVVPYLGKNKLLSNGIYNWSKYKKRFGFPSYLDNIMEVLVKMITKFPRTNALVGKNESLARGQVFVFLGYIMLKKTTVLSEVDKTIISTLVKPSGPCTTADKIFSSIWISTNIIFSVDGFPLGSWGLVYAT